MRALSAASCLVVFFAASPAWAEDPRISVKAELDPQQAGAGESLRLDLAITVPAGWHLWSLDPGPGPLPLVIKTKAKSAELSGAWYGDAPKVVFDRGFERDLAHYGDGVVKLSRAFTIKDKAAAGKQTVHLRVRGQICTDAQCLTQDEKIELSFDVAAAATGLALPMFSGSELTVAATSESKSLTSASKAGSLEEARAQGIFWFIFWAFGFGIAALATPCVFPAIPLTVSFFSKYSEESFGRGARLAGVYAATMVAAFTLAGVLVSILFGVTGIQEFAAHPAFNVALGVVLVFFSLNLLGLFEIKAPTFLMTGVNQLEAKFGRASTLGASAANTSRKSDYLIVMIAALTATTVFFTCTVGFVGLVLVSAAQGEWFWPSIGMLSFASAFALPFFLLAMFPQGAKRLQGKAGSWLGASRVTLGFLELAAATKFLSNADLVWKWELLTRSAVLVFWIPLFVLCAFYLLGKLRLGHESMERPDGGTSIMQMLAATLMFGFSLTLAVGLFNGKPFGGWLDGWLPPVTYPSASGGATTVAGANGQPTFRWIHSLTAGREDAADKDRLVFVNYTGYTCTNCRYMEGGMFPRPEIAALLQTMSLVELYTDGGDDIHTAAREDQVRRFKTAALPLYSVETADGQILGHFPSSTNDPEEFRRFIEEAIAKAPQKRVPPQEESGAVGLVLTTQRLSDGKAHAALQTGKWNLVNFWATWCGPCKIELREFMVRMGKDLSARGGHFAVVAVEEDESVPAALSFMKDLKVPDSSALRVSSDYDETNIDGRFEFDGSLPFTALVSPTGEIVWRHGAAVTEEELRAVLLEHTGFASLLAAP